MPHFSENDPTKFYPAKYVLQYINNSTTNKLINYYSNFVAVVNIVLIVKVMTHIDARSYEISKLKNFLEKPSNLLRSLEFVIHQNCTCLRVKSQYKKVKHFLTNPYRSGELHNLVNFNLILSLLKRF